MAAWISNFKILFGSELFSQGSLPFLHASIPRFEVKGDFLLFLGVCFCLDYGGMLVVISP